MKPQPPATTFARLRLYGDHLVPEEITEALGQKPSYATMAKNVEFSTIVPVRISGVWDLETIGRVDSHIAEEHIQWIIDFLDDAHQVAMQLPGVEDAEMWCSWQPKDKHGGPSFSPTILQDLARHGLILTVDCFSGNQIHAGLTS